MEVPQPRVVIENCAIATMDGRQHDDTGAEHRSGHIAMSGGRITAVGEGPAPASAAAGARRVDGTGDHRGGRRRAALPSLPGFDGSRPVRRFHDPSPGAMVRVAVAPCSPFSVSSRLMREMAELARGLGVRLHTHLAETREEDAYCRQTISRRQALWIGTRGGAACLGRADEIGALRPGMLADVALWRVDTLARDAIARHAGPDGPDGDPVAALVFGPPAPLELLLVGGTPVVERGELRTVDMTAARREVRAARRRITAR